MTRAFVQLDVFAAKPGDGNPLAVVLDAAGLDDATMQAIARQNKAIQDTYFPGKANKERLARYSEAVTENYERLKDIGWIVDGVDRKGNTVPAFQFQLLPTSYYGQLVRSKHWVNPVGEVIASESDITARAVEIVI